jgi:hypothetical protein
MCAGVQALGRTCGHILSYMDEEGEAAYARYRSLYAPYSGGLRNKKDFAGVEECLLMYTRRVLSSAGHVLYNIRRPRKLLDNWGCRYIPVIGDIVS